MQDRRGRLFCTGGRGDLGEFGGIWGVFWGGSAGEAGQGLGGAILSQERPPLALSPPCGDTPVLGTAG